MKKRSYFVMTVLAALTMLSLSSCLKDPRYVNFAQSSPIVNFPLGGTVNFSADAITETPDTDANGTIVRQFTVDIASASIPTTDTKVTLAIDNSLIAAYNATETAVAYEQMPDGSFVFNTTSVTIPAGKRTAVVSVTFYKNKLDPSKSYMLPIKIVSGPSGTIVSGNLGIHYYHFIGNDFAGAYLWDYTRIPAAGNFVGQPGTIYPVTPTQFEMVSGYFTVTIRYEVTFTKNADGTYSNFAVDLNPDDVQNILVANGLTLVQHPKFVNPNPDPNHKYTYSEVVHGLLKLNWTTATRNITDYYYKP